MKNIIASVLQSVESLLNLDGDKFTNLNFYGYFLSLEESVAITFGDKCGQQGDYLAWRDIKLALTSEKDISKTELDLGEICNHQPLHRFLYSPAIEYWESVLSCAKFQGSQPYAPSSAKEYEEYRRYFLKINSDSGGDRFHDHWLPISDEQVEGEWRHSATNEVQTFFDWGPGQPNGGDVQNCGCLRKFNGYRWDDCGCTTYSWPIICRREEGQPVLRLRGLCPFSDIDTIYTPKNFGLEGETMFVSYDHTQITRDHTASVWEARRLSRGGNWTRAVTRASTNSLAIGTHTWTVTNDSKRCSAETEYEVVLTLTGCRDDEFTCREGFCIGMMLRCDGVVNCRDQSDEVGCIKVVIKESYNRQIAPPPLGNRTKADIQITITIHSILQIDEIGKTFYVSFSMDASWTDPRLVYYNTKRNTDLNVLSSEEVDGIWTPKLIFYNTRNKEETVTDEKSIVAIIPGPDFTFSSTDISHSENIYIFSGAENKLKLSQTHDTVFLCTYDMAWYPFDTQVVFQNRYFSHGQRR